MKSNITLEARPTVEEEIKSKVNRCPNNSFFCNKSKKRLFLVIFRYFKLSMDLKAARYVNSLNYKIENKVIVVPSFVP